MYHPSGWDIKYTFPYMMTPCSVRMPNRSIKEDIFVIYVLFIQREGCASRVRGGFGSWSATSRQDVDLRVDVTQDKSR